MIRRAACRSARLLVQAVLSACWLVGCGAEVPAGGVKSAAEATKPPPAHFDPADLIPADLDLVVRVDLGRMKDALGPGSATRLSGEHGGEPLLDQALERAEIAWVAVRVADIDAGDRLVIVEGKVKALTVDSTRFREAAPPHPEVKAYERIGPHRRDEVAEILVIGDRAIAFVSPVERDSVRRVLRRGRDAGRGDPVAEGFVSLDYRVQRLTPRLERKFPSISALLGSVERVRATARLTDDGVVIESTLQGETAQAAEKATRFLEVLRDNVEAPHLAELLGEISIEQIDAVVRVDWTVPGEVVLAALEGGAPSAPPPTTRPAPEAPASGEPRPSEEPETP